MAVSLANELCERGHFSNLCATRSDGPLRAQLSSGVDFLSLQRSSRFDLNAILRLRDYLRANQIEVIHAHSSSIFLSAIVRGHGRGLLWHDHYGAHGMEARDPRPYRLIRSRLDGVVAVDPALRRWAVGRVGLKPGRAWELPNFAKSRMQEAYPPVLPGRPGARIVCVANLRPQKDHANLLRAMAGVLGAVPDAHLICAGADTDLRYSEAVRRLISDLGLGTAVTLVGEQAEIGPLLRSCDVAVLASASEGFPLALLEYGSAGRAVVCTDVGQCREILADGLCGVIVPPGDPGSLASALVFLLQNARERTRLGESLQNRVTETYSADRVMERLLGIYELISN